MKLYTSPTSPYARLVRTVLLEKQLDSRVTPVWVNPWESPEALLAVSPFSRVPVLEDEEGVCLTESAIIALYLERRFPEPRLMPLDRVEEVHR
ncbi:glutathione S-transferase family protein, partial [Arhodomonas sp. KWT]